MPGGEAEKKPDIEEGSHVQASNADINWFKSLTDSLPVEDNAVGTVASPSEWSIPRIQQAPFETPYCNTKVFVLSPIRTTKADGNWLPDGERERDRIQKTNRRLAARFIKDYNLPESICDEMQKNINTFRRYYQDEALNNVGSYSNRLNYNDLELSRMFILHGSALLFYIVCYCSDNLHKLGFDDRTLDEARHDIFKLENQLPYGVLELLMENSKLGKEMPRLIHDFIESHSLVPGDDTYKLKARKPHHLLDLLRTRMRGVDPISNEPTKNHERLKGPIKWSPSHTVEDLKAAWIRLKPGTALTQILFRPGIVSGEFELPPLTIDKSTQVKLLNLIDYEMCPDFENDLSVTSYICFLHSFVANVEDVADLRSAGVLINYLSSNEEVLKLFSEITCGLVPNPAVYRAIQKEIKKHFDRKRRTTMATWFAEAAQVYFKTPWSTITVLAATFAIILSVVQTYFATFPRK